MSDIPEIHYAKARDGVHIAYQVFGEGEVELFWIPGFVSHLELFWDHPAWASYFRRLGTFARVILFDRRGMGLSDSVPNAPTLEERMADILAVMDAVGFERPVLYGASEGAPTAILFAATYPDRTAALVLHGGMAKGTQAEDYDFATPADALRAASAELLAPLWGEGATAEVFCPSVAGDPAVRAFFARLERNAASPAMIRSIFEMFLQIDVRHILPLIQIPTLVLHRTGDRVVNVRSGRYLAEHIPGARLVEVAGSDHQPVFQTPELFLDEIEQFLTGVRGAHASDRVLATVLFSDVVDSTETAAALGDETWRTRLNAHDELIRRHVEAFGGRVVKSTGDGALATFDGPSRAIRCALEIREAVRVLDLELRIGLHTGEVEMRGPSGEEDVSGIAVHIAARVMAQAGAGEVLVSGSIPPLVAGSGIEFADRGAHELKGVPGEWQLFEVL